MNRKTEKPVFFGGRWSGISQLTLVEHALSPLQSDGPFEGVADYYYSVGGKRTLGTANISTSHNAEDEFYLWGLLALTLSQPGEDPVLYASARYMLRHLGMGEGGDQSNRLRAVIKRLSSFRYQNDDFYDPVRKSHREAGFGFLSHDLPKRKESIQGWNIYWDQKFLDLVKNAGGFLAFDLETYGSLSPAAGRLFLLLSKYFFTGRRKRTVVTPYHDVPHLAVNGLGYAADLKPKQYNQRIRKCICELVKLSIVPAETDVERVVKGEYRVRFARGAYFDSTPKKRPKLAEKDQAVYETLGRIGLDDDCIRWVLREFTISLVNQWADVTFAAIDGGRVRQTPQKFFVHHIKRAKAGEITPPDWYREIERDRERKNWAETRKTLARMGINPPGADDEFEVFLERDGRAEYASLVRTLVGNYRQSGCDSDEARSEAERRARKELKRKFVQRQQQEPRRRS